MILVWIALGGGVGSVLRYLLYTRVDQLHGYTFPLGILTVNLIGSFLMGFLAWAFTSHITLAEEHRAAILVGLLGGFTTFSTFSHDTLQHFIQGEYAAVILNIVLSVVLCIISAGAGLLMARSLLT
ncbi:MAG: fluoride efflux transporter CrcB [Gammaproteobacteria bacterium]|nr:fluoride efflux transporter CrcB [Gammaproteobacteria bacterium]